MYGQEWKVHRGEATRLAAEEQQLLQRTRNAYNSGDGAMAKCLSDKRKELQLLMEEANEKAANKIFEENNKNLSIDTIDLHGLYVREAIQKLSEHISNATNVQMMTVIVGQGRHSEGGPKIKPAVMQYAQDNHIPCYINFLNPGCINLDLSFYSPIEYSSSENSSSKKSENSDDGEGAHQNHIPSYATGSEELLSFLRRATECNIRWGRI